jgi:glycosyltransferase involved in cell wall biosynthesis
MRERAGAPVSEDPPPCVTRCDLHVHSRASRGNDEWFTRFFGCPESYIEPELQYELCCARGMDFFTLTDHDTIDGCLALANRPGVFLSEEVTAVFPEESCTIHVLAWNITPEQHAAIQERRPNVYHLVDYLSEQGIAHAAAHPLLSPSWNLTADTLEKLLLLFPVLERVNGLLDARIARDFEHLVEQVDGRALRSWAQKHGLSIRGNLHRRRAFTAGSDDHTLRRSGRVFTEVPDPPRTPAEFLNAVRAGRGRAVGEHASLEDMATTIQRTSYEHLRRKGTEEGSADLFVDVLDAVMGQKPTERRSAVAHAFSAAIRTHLADAVPTRDLESVVSLTRTPDADAEREAIERAQRVSDGFLGQAARALLTAIPGFDLCGMLDAGRDAIGALVAAGPLLGAADHFGRQEQQVRRIWAGWSAFPPPPTCPVTALFSDSMGHKDGVSTWCDRIIAQASRAGEGMVVPVVEDAGGDASSDYPYRSIPSVASYPLPFYSSFKLNLPSLMAVVRMLWRDRVTHVELATPGPMGLIGGVAARILRLPVTASFHTDIVALGELLGGDPIPLGALRRYVRWFYAAADRVRVFSPPSRDAILRLGVPLRRIDLVMPQVDPGDFSPSHRDAGIFERLGVPRNGRPVVLSVGRVSREKNLPRIIDAVRRLQGRVRPAPVLVVVGDGPERLPLERATAGMGFAFFVGHQEGLVLRQLYASAQVFAFASELDTLGLVNLEALASGLPTVVPQDSNVASLLQHDRDAYCYPRGPHGLETALATLLEDRERAARLSAAGLRFVTEKVGATVADDASCCGSHEDADQNVPPIVA